MVNEQPLISVIVPVYNVEPYLEECIASILNQTYQNLELLLIDDGSTDKSGEICQEFAEKDNRVQYVRQNNQGVAAARNKGIEHASGEFISFVDSDDFIDDSYFGLLYDKMMEHDSDVVISNYFEFRESDSQFLFHIFDEQPDKVFQPNQEFWDYLFKNSIQDISLGGILSKLFKKHLFDNVRFNEKLRMVEDTEVMYRLYLAANRIVYVHRAIYCYRRTVGSLSSEIDEEQTGQLLQMHEERMTALSVLGFDIKEALNVYHHVLNFLNGYMEAEERLCNSYTHQRIKQLLGLIQLNSILESKEMKQPLISVIIPVYNVEAYVGQCIQSILNQTYQNFELLLIDDGSIDKSGEICQEFAKKDNRVQYVRQDNKGVAAARNHGIDRSKGDLLTFVDSDDWLEEQALAILYEKIVEYDADVSIASYYQYREEDSAFLFHILGEHYYERLFTPQEIFKEFSDLTGFDASFVIPVSKLYKKPLFERIRFPEGVNSEDEAFNYRVFLEAEKIIYINQGLYGYRRIEGSRSQTKTENFIKDTLKNLEERITILAMTNGDVSGFLPHYKGRLLGFEHDMRVNWGMEDTELYRRIKENLYLIEKFGNK